MSNRLLDGAKRKGIKSQRLYEPTTQLRKGSYGSRPFNVNKSVAVPSNVKGHKTAHRPGRGGAGR